MTLTQSIQQPTTPKQQLIFYILTSIGLVVLWKIYSLYLTPIFFPLDDAYTVLHNAQVLHWGHDPNFIDTPALTGSTSALHLALVALLLFWLKPTAALLATQWLALFIYTFGLLRLAFLYQASIWQTSVLLIAGLTIGYMPYQALSGLETTLAMGAIVWSLILAKTSITKPQRFSLAALCGVLPFLRPELSLWSILLLLYQAHRYWEQQTNLLLTFTQFSQDCLVALICASPWLLWYWLDTGFLYPTTASAKTAFYATSHWPWAEKLHALLKRLAVFTIDIGYLSFFAMFALLVITPLGRLAIIFMLSITILFMAYLPNAIYFNFGRYLYIWLPLLLYGNISCINHPDKLLRIGTNIVLLAIFLQAIWFFPKHWHTYLDTRGYTKIELVGLTNWLKKNISPQSNLLVHDVGYVAFATNFHLTDMVGLKTPSSIDAHKKTPLIPAITSIIQHNNPHYLIIQNAWDKDFNIARGLSAANWDLKLLHTSADGYLVYRINQITPSKA